MSEVSDIVALFRQMADRIEKNDAKEFGGALLVVPPPDQNGQLQALDVLLIDPRRDPVAFYAMALSKVQIAAAMFEEQARARERQGFR